MSKGRSKSIGKDKGKSKDKGKDNCKDRGTDRGNGFFSTNVGILFKIGKANLGWPNYQLDHGSTWIITYIHPYK
jgi:hypothetical protein